MRPSAFAYAAPVAPRATKKKKSGLFGPIRATVPLAVGLLYALSLFTWHIAYIAVFALLVTVLYAAASMICLAVLNRSASLAATFRKHTVVHILGMALCVLLVAGILATGVGTYRYISARADVNSRLALLDEQTALHEKNLRAAMEVGIVEDKQHCKDFFEAYAANCTLRESDLRVFLTSPLQDILGQFKLAKPSQAFAAAVSAVRNITQQADETKNDQTLVRAFSVTQMLTDALTPICDDARKSRVYWPAVAPLLVSIVLAQLDREKWWQYGLLVVFAVLWFAQPSWTDVAAAIFGQETIDKMTKEDVFGTVAKAIAVAVGFAFKAQFASLLAWK